MAKDKKMQYNSVEITHEGKRIILPVGMSQKEAIIWLERNLEEQESVVSLVEQIPAYPLDGAVALMKVLKERYGWTTLAPSPGFFGDKPPQMVSVNIGPNPTDTIQVPWGRIVIPGVEGYINTSYTTNKDGQPEFLLNANVKRKHEVVVHEIANRVREVIRTDSIYRGKALVLNFRNTSGERIEAFNIDFCPQFLDVSHADENRLIFNDSVIDQIKTNLFTPIESSDACRKHGIPLKRGILLEGPYGTGKTLTANVTGKKCVENGWTFIYLKEVKDLDMAILMAKQYMPCAIFAEDIDAAFPKDEKTDENRRTSETNQIFNVLDGVETKGTEIMVILTTNDIESIRNGFEGFLRPGRIDAVIHVALPDTSATVRLVRQYGNNLISATDEELTEAVQPIVGKNAAVIREVVERAKLSAIRRCGTKKITIVAGDISISANAMQYHLNLLQPKRAATPNMYQLAGMALAETAGKHLQPALEFINGRVDKIEEAVDNI